MKNLPYDRGDAALVAYLNGLAAHGLLVVYHNWMNRLVKPQPRVVRKSKAFQLNPLTTQRATLLRSSRTSNRGETSQNISVEIDPDGFVSRGKQKHADEPLLFAVFQQQTAYLIDIMKHGDWARDHVLEGLVAGSFIWFRSPGQRALPEE